jgi:guanine deaminase
MRTFAAMPVTSSRPTALRGPVLTYTGDPFRDGLDKTMVHEPDAIVAMADGKVTHFGPADQRSRPTCQTARRSATAAATR